MTRLVLPLALVFLVGAPAAVGQESDTELLRAMLCELRELRAAVQRGQLVAPLLEANVEERLGVEKRLAESRKEWDELDQALQDWIRQQARGREMLAELPVDGGFGSPEEVKTRKEVRERVERELRIFTGRLQATRAQLAELGGQISQLEGRLAALEEEYAEMKRQMLAMATSTGCSSEEGR